MNEILLLFEHLLLKNRPKNAKRINFSLTGKFDNEKESLMITIYEIIGKTRKFLYETLPVSKSEPINNRPGLFYFERVEINTDSLETEFISTILLEFEIKRVKFDKKQKESYKVLGSETAKLKSILELTDANTIQLNIKKSKKILRGTLNIGDSLLTPIFSFLDYKIHLDIKVIPVIAIDYSLSNLTFDSKRQLIHTQKESEDNDYRSILNHILKVYKNLAPFVMGFGMGGKTYPKQQNASDIFSLTGNMFNPILNKDQVFEKYWEVFERIKVSLPINYSPVWDLVSDYAIYEKENYEARNFFSLIYITPGVIDDYEKTLEAIKEIKDLPMWITVVKIKNDQLKDTNDTLTLYKDLEEDLENWDRKFYNYIDYQHFKDTNNLHLLEEELIKEIPTNVQRYYAESNIFAFDLEENDYASRMSVRQKKEQVMIAEGRSYSVEVDSRKSVVGLKEFLRELRDERYEDEEGEDEEEKKDQVECKVDIPSTENSSRNLLTNHESGDSQGSFSEGRRRLSYCGILEEKYIANVSISENQPKERIETLVKSGQIFDETHEYLCYLMSIQNEQGN